MKYGVTVYHNNTEVKGFAKLKYLTLSQILENYILIPIYDALKALNKFL